MPLNLAHQLRQDFGLLSEEVGIVIVDHGSRREESNRMLVELVGMFQVHAELPIVEPAHMELAEPTIAQAFDRCVARGAKLVVTFPYFLLPGRHWQEDIPRLVAEAAAKHPQVRSVVTAPLALHPLIFEVIGERIAQCLAHVEHEGDSCDACQHGGGCRPEIEA